MRPRGKKEALQPRVKKKLCSQGEEEEEEEEEKSFVANAGGGGGSFAAKGGREREEEEEEEKKKSFVAKGKKMASRPRGGKNKPNRFTRLTNASHCPTKTISKTDIPPLRASP